MKAAWRELAALIGVAAAQQLGGAPSAFVDHSRGFATVFPVALTEVHATPPGATEVHLVVDGVPKYFVLHVRGGGGVTSAVGLGGFRGVCASLNVGNAECPGLLRAQVVVSPNLFFVQPALFSKLGTDSY
jgi:hypothetical protein